MIVMVNFTMNVPTNITMIITINVVMIFMMFVVMNIVMNVVMNIIIYTTFYPHTTTPPLPLATTRDKWKVKHCGGGNCKTSSIMKD